MIIRNDHYSLTTAATALQEMVSPLSSLGINYFSWGRHYNDGGRVWLCNVSENITNYYSNKLYRMGNTEAHPSSYKPQIVLWSTLPNQNVFQFIKQRGVSNGIFIIEPNNEYCEFTAFGLKQTNQNYINTFLTHLEMLKKFKEHFKEKGASLVKQSEEHKIYLPYHNKLLPNLNAPDSPLSSHAAGFNAKLSRQQYSCAKLLIQGKTTKEIACILSLSPRTIESYINNIKLKLNCDNRAQLIIKLVELLK